MYPTLFTVGPFTIHSFGLMVALAFFAGLNLMTYLSKKDFVKNLKEENVTQLLIYIMLGGAFGARIAYVCEHWSVEFADQPIFEIFRFDKGGLMFYGGLFGAIIAIALFSRIKKINLIELLDLCAILIPLGHAFGRIGCFLNGCCYGRVCQGPISITYPPHSPAWCEQVAAGQIGKGALESLPVLPSQLIEAAANIILFFCLFSLAKKKNRKGFISGVYLISYGVIRFFTEMLRSDPRMSVGVLSIGQFLSIGILITGVVFIYASHRFAAQPTDESNAK